MAPAWSRAVSDSVARLDALAPWDEVNSTPGGMVIWDGMGVGNEAFEGVGEALGLRANTLAGLADLGLATPDSGGEDGKQRFAGAAALALAGVRGERFPVDFLHTRLSVRQRPRLRRRLAWSAAVTIAICAACTAFLMGWRQDEMELAALQER